MVEEGKYIVVELGELSKIGKFSLPDDKRVKEFWFGDKTNFIYSLSRKAPMTQQASNEEGESYLLHIANYYKDHCVTDRRLKDCESSYSAYDCNDAGEAAHDFLGIRF